MHHALAHSLTQYTKSVLIGTDCPIMDRNYVVQAFDTLNQDNKNQKNIVFGPATDGGYVLVGVNKIGLETIGPEKINSGPFNKVDWSTSRVLEQSVQHCRAADYTVHLLDTLWDIDTPEDYIKYQQHLSPPHAKP